MLTSKIKEFFRRSYRIKKNKTVNTVIHMSNIFFYINRTNFCFDSEISMLIKVLDRFIDVSQYSKKCSVKKYIVDQHYLVIIIHLLHVYLDSM